MVLGYDGPEKSELVQNWPENLEFLYVGPEKPEFLHIGPQMHVIDLQVANLMHTEIQLPHPGMLHFFD